MRVIIIGAGIGGAALALTLDHLGIDFVVLEQARAFEDVGAGIQLSPNGVRILERLGLAQDLAAYVCEPDSHKFMSWDSGETVLRTPLMPRAKEEFGSAYYHAHRRDVVGSLTGRLDRSRVRMNTRVEYIGQTDDRVWALCADGSRVEGDVLIGADGIHSLVRERIFRPDPPRRSGYVAWRGVLDADRVAHLQIPVSSYVAMGPRMSFVYYYVAGGRQMNWLALGEADDEKIESWHQSGDRDELLGWFEGWYSVPKTMIEATEEPFVTALFDRVPLSRWVDGKIAIMGDAAHAMLPYHAQGAVQSIEDAWVLGRCLDEAGESVEQALFRYQELRHDRTTRMVQHSQQAEGWYHIDDPKEVAARNRRFGEIGTQSHGGFTRQQNWLYAYDAELAVNGTDDAWRALPDW
ncbi:MAG: FAD-dependent monooxygenase [Alphaproteobacteria bacterium]